jgi:hypothetical protein
MGRKDFSNDQIDIAWERQMVDVLVALGLCRTWVAGGTLITGTQIAPITEPQICCLYA